MKKIFMLIALLAGFSVASYAVEMITVYGTVFDSEGEPLVGAVVMAEGTTIGVCVDMDGTYSLTCPKGCTLVYSFLSCITEKAYNVNQSCRIDVILEFDDDWEIFYGRSIRYTQGVVSVPERQDAILPGRQRYFC